MDLGTNRARNQLWDTSFQISSGTNRSKNKLQDKSFLTHLCNKSFQKQTLSTNKLRDKSFPDEFWNELLFWDKKFPKQPIWSYTLHAIRHTLYAIPYKQPLGQIVPKTSSGTNRSKTGSGTNRSKNKKRPNKSFPPSPHKKKGPGMLPASRHNPPHPVRAC